MAKIEILERWITDDGKKAIRARFGSIEIHYMDDNDRYFILNPCLVDFDKARVLNKIKGML